MSNGSLKVVRLSVFGGVGLGCRGKDEANVDVVPVFVGDEFSIKTKELHGLYNIIFLLIFLIKNNRIIHTYIHTYVHKIHIYIYHK